MTPTDMPVMGDANTPPDARGEFAFAEPVSQDYSDPRQLLEEPAQRSLIQAMSGEQVMQALTTVESATVDGYPVANLTNQETRVALGHVIGLCNDLGQRLQTAQHEAIKMGQMIEALQRAQLGETDGSNS